MGIVIRQSLKGTVLTYLGAAVGFITQMFIVTKFLDPEVIGLTKVFYEAALFCAGFALLGITSAGMRFFPYFKDEKTANHGFFFYYSLVPIVGFALIAIIYCACKAPILNFFGAKSPLFADYFYLVLPLIFILTFWQALENYSNINMRIAFPKGIREVLARVLMLVNYLLYAFGYLSLAGMMVCLVAVYGICLLTDFLYVRATSPVSLKHDNSFITRDLKNKYLKYTGFLLLAAISGNIIPQLDLFMLSSVKGMYSAGIYTIALYMVNVIDMPSRSITAISTPIAAAVLKEGDLETANSLYKKVSLHQLLCSSLLLLVIWINIDNIFLIIPNGDTFAEGKFVVLFLGLSRIIYTTLNFGNVLIQFSRYYYWTLFITIFLTILTICSNLYFIPRMGISGAAVATLITTVVSSIYQQYLVQKKVHGNPFTWKSLLAIGIVLSLWGINKLIPSLTEISPWLDAAVRSSVICILAAFIIYILKISEEFNSLLRKLPIKL